MTEGLGKGSVGKSACCAHRRGTRPQAPVITGWGGAGGLLQLSVQIA